MLNRVLELQANQAPFDIKPQLRRIQNMKMGYPEMFDKLEPLSREDLKEIVSSTNHSYKDKLFAILLRGIYFEVVQKGPKLKLLEWINQDDSEDEIGKRFKAISESNSPRTLFKSFQNEFKIPGLGFAYFTKIFYFVRKAEGKTVYPILDKWLICAYTAISAEIEGNLNTFIKYMKEPGRYNFDGGLRRKKPECYENYVHLMTTTSEERGIDIDVLEEKLFGVDLRRDSSMHNPRNMYRNWAVNSALSTM